jgi:hypothetical protein
MHRLVQFGCAQFYIDLIVKIIEITDQFITRNDPVIVIKRNTKYTTLSEHFIKQIKKKRTRVNLWRLVVFVLLDL